MHFPKTKSQKFHKCVLKKIIQFSKKQKKEKCGESFVHGSLNTQDCEY